MKNSTPFHGNNEISVIFVSDAFEDGDEVILDDGLSQTRALQKEVRLNQMVILVAKGCN